MEEEKRTSLLPLQTNFSFFSPFLFLKNNKTARGRRGERERRKNEELVKERDGAGKRALSTDLQKE